MVRRMNSKTSEKYIKFNWESLVYWIAVVILFTLVLIFCFYRLGESTISDWDEARHGVNAYEMMQNREWIVTTYKGNPDYWNLKPPLSEWIICAFFSIFGYTRTVFRIYSAVSMFLCAGILFIWSYKRIGRIGACLPFLLCLQYILCGLIIAQGLVTLIVCSFCYVRLAHSALPKHVLAAQHL